MFRALLLTAMIYQVLGCSYACMAGLPSTSDSSRAVGCRCCQHKRCAEMSLPAQEQEKSSTACFCNSPVVPAASLHVDLDVFAARLVAIVEVPPQQTVVVAAMDSNEHWSPGGESGMGLRISVQSFLL